MKEDLKHIVIFVFVAIILGFCLILISIQNINNAERELSYADDPDEIEEKQFSLYRAKEISRVLSFFGFISILIGSLALIIGYISDINENVESLRKQLNHLIDMIEKGRK